MRKVVLLVVGLLLVTGLGASKAVEETFYAYVDSGLCAHLNYGPIDAKRQSCTEKSFKQKAELVLVRLKDNMIFEVSKGKQLKPLAGKTVRVTCETKVTAGTAKIITIEEVPLASIPAADIAGGLLDVRGSRVTNNTVAEQVRHTLAMMPYISDFDFISFVMLGEDVLLTGWTIRDTNRSGAYNRVKQVEGVRNITNNIEVLPMGSMDMRVRAQARARLQRLMPQYFWSSGSAIKILVKNGNILLLGAVANQSAVDIANVQCNSIPGAFQVVNMLQVAPAKGQKG